METEIVEHLVAGHRFPIRRLYAPVYHVGRLAGRGESSQRYSLEGRGLSVSQDPDSWRQIARLGGAPCYALMAQDRPLQLLDVHACLEQPGVMEMVGGWAEGKGLTQRATVYEAHQCDEQGELTRMVFLDRDEALAQVDDDPDWVQVRRGWKATPALTERMAVSRVDPLLVEDYLLLVFAEDMLNLDGAWWDEQLAPEIFSAPRGVIFDAMMEKLTITEASPQQCLDTTPAP